MRLLLPLILLFCAAPVVQAGWFDDIWNAGVKIFEAIASPFVDSLNENAVKKCPYILAVLNGTESALPMVGTSSAIWNIIYKCEKRLEGGELSFADIWGPFGQFMKAMAAQMPD